MMELRQIQIGNVFDLDKGAQTRMMVERITLDQQDNVGVILTSTTELIQRRVVCDYKLLEPIPLTDDILQEMGFEWDITRAMWEKDNFWVLNSGPEVGFLAYPTMVDYLFSIPVPYLHTLQNLFWAIKGYELKVPLTHFD